uniref:ARAD1D08800p n=1 Tax=Blastobotrys adeninivorans TaxID=409370 RepID=A0A060TEL7_BLAAD
MAQTPKASGRRSSTYLRTPRRLGSPDITAQTPYSVKAKERQTPRRASRRVQRADPLDIIRQLSRALVREKALKKAKELDEGVNGENVGPTGAWKDSGEHEMEKGQAEEANELSANSPDRLSLYHSHHSESPLGQPIGYEGYDDGGFNSDDGYDNGDNGYDDRNDEFNDADKIELDEVDEPGVSLHVDPEQTRFIHSRKSLLTPRSEAFDFEDTIISEGRRDTFGIDKMRESFRIDFNKELSPDDSPLAAQNHTMNLNDLNLEDITLPIQVPALRKDSTNLRPSTAVPTRVIRDALKTFSSSKVPPDALDAIVSVSNRYFEQIANDLNAYADHAGRSKADSADVLHLMKRQRLVGPNQTAFALAHQYLPVELLDEIKFTSKAKGKGKDKRVDND